MMYGYTLLVPMNQRVLNKLSKERNISGHKWSRTHRVLKSHKSKMGVIYMQLWKQCALPKKDKLFSSLFVFHRGMSNAICNLVLYLQNEGLNFSYGICNTIFYSAVSQKPVYFSKVRWIDIYEISEVNLGKSEYIYFELFEVWFFKFFFNRVNHEDEHP